MLALVLLGVASWAQVEPASEISALVAVRDLPPGQVIRAADLIDVTILADYVPQNVLVERSDVEMRVVREPILEGEFLREERLTPENSGRNVGALVPAGKRLLKLPLEPASSWPQPSHWVDIAYVREGALCLAAQRVQVLYTESRPDRFQSYGTVGREATSVLVAVSPRQIQQLMAPEPPIFLLRGPTDRAMEAEGIELCSVPGDAEGLEDQEQDD